ncbi:hypothetical protein DV737_g4933, partial [Chaetothyriales sp. CBS 132003]
MLMSEAELKRLAHSEYWDERYGEVGPDEQVHEWFRSFDDLVPLFDRHLFRMDQIPSESVDVAFDKGTLDAMIYGSPWDPPDEVLDNTGRYVREVFRILKSDGTFIYVTYRQPHFIKPLLNCEGAKWDIEVDILASSESSLEYHGFILKKAISSAAESAEAEVEKGTPS